MSFTAGHTLTPWQLTTWREVGAPDAERLHNTSKLADRTTVYSRRDPEKVIAAWAGSEVARLLEVVFVYFYDVITALDLYTDAISDHQVR